MGLRLVFALALIAPIWSTNATLAAPAAVAPASAPTDLAGIKSRAEALRKKGDLAGATDLLWKNVEKLDTEGYLLLGRMHESRKEWNEVIRASGLLIAKKPKDPQTAEALTLVGRAQFMKGKITDAKEALKQALELNKLYEPAYDVYAQIYEKMPYEQRLLYQDMVETFGPKPKYLTKLCAINTADGENEQGSQICNQAIKADGKIADNHVNLGVIAKQKGEPELARKYLRAAADMFPDSEYAQHQFALFLEEEKNYVDSFKYYERCLSANPGADACAAGVGISGLQIQKFERALAALKQVCNRNGRKYSAQIRKAIRLTQGKDASWRAKFEDIADRCGR